ncbi:MAG: cell division protein FtsA [Candidatus Omnitrophica bacterium]|nr:cell division protein FtsA [Candidatus Omnitrophota bacterium]
MTKEKIIAGLDIGTSKVCCVIGSKTNDGTFNILSCAFAKNDCVKKGVVVNLKGLSDVISRVIYKAESEADTKINSVYVNVMDANIEGIKSRGEVVISDRDSEITRYNVRKADDNARSISIPYEREILHYIHYGYTIDGEKGIADPSGMFGIKLESDLYLITTKAAMFENLKKAIRQSGTGIAAAVVSSIPTSMALLSKHEKQIGTALVDIGADLTEVSIYTEGLMRYLKVMTIGGNNVTNQISAKLNLSESAAESLKLESGILDREFTDDDKLILNVDSRKRVVRKKELQAVLQESYKKMFADIKEAAYKSHIFRDASNGVVLTGGSSMLEGAAEMAEIEFGCPVRIGHITELANMPRSMSGHIFATATGLVKYGFKEIEKRKDVIRKGPKNAISSAVDYIRRLYREYF